MTDTVTKTVTGTVTDTVTDTVKDAGEGSVLSGGSNLMRLGQSRAPSIRLPRNP